MTDEQMNLASVLAGDMKRVAQYGIYDGLARTPAMRRYVNRCGRFDAETGTRLLFTRDGGMHTMGWWKNPDYNQCLHLSVSFLDVETMSRAPHDHETAAQWCRLFYDGMVNLIWVEPPFSPVGKKAEVWHYRVFVSPDFKTPLLPRGEVYSRELTERGWKSWSDLHAEPQETAHT